MKLINEAKEKRLWEIINEAVDLDIYVADFGEWIDELPEVQVVEVEEDVSMCKLWRGNENPTANRGTTYSSYPNS